MAVWKYYKALAPYYPVLVLVDIGNILSAKVGHYEVPIITIKTDDGVYCGGGMNPHIIAVTGYCNIGRVSPEKTRFLDFPKDIEDGQIVEWPEDVSWWDMGDAVCIDPRVVYLNNRAWKLIRTNNVTEKDWDELNNEPIPTKEQALRWMRENGYQAEPVLRPSCELGDKAGEWLDKDNERLKNS